MGIGGDGHDFTQVHADRVVNADEFPIDDVPAGSNVDTGKSAEVSFLFMGSGIFSRFIMT